MAATTPLPRASVQVTPNPLAYWLAGLVFGLAAIAPVIVAVLLLTSR